MVDKIIDEGAAYFKKELEQPKLYISVANDGSRQSNLGASANNDASRALFPEEVIYNFRLEWTYIITVRNNSEVNAHMIKLLNPVANNISIFIDKIESTKVLKPFEELQFKIRYSIPFEGNAAQVALKFRQCENIGYPQFFGNILLGYSNLKNVKFYTAYSQFVEDEKKNSFKMDKQIKKRYFLVALFIVVAIAIGSYIAINSSKDNKANNQSIGNKNIQSPNIKADSSIVLNGNNNTANSNNTTNIYLQSPEKQNKKIQYNDTLPRKGNKTSGDLNINAQNSTVNVGSNNGNTYNLYNGNAKETWILSENDLFKIKKSIDDLYRTDTLLTAQSIRISYTKDTEYSENTAYQVWLYLINNRYNINKGIDNFTAYYLKGISVNKVTPEGPYDFKNKKKTFKPSYISVSIGFK